MGSMTNQILAVVMMNVRSLPQRFWMSLATVLAVGVVVAVLLAFLSMGNGFVSTVEGTGSDNIAVILRSGSQAELNSVLSRDQVNLVEVAPGIASGENGPLISAELYVIVDGYKRSTGTEVNLPLRGISPEGAKLRGGINIVEGRMFEPGTNEIVVGTGVLREFRGFDLGAKVKLGSANWTVVGAFDSGGSVFESELWADSKTIQSQFNRGSTVQLVRVFLDKPDDIATLKAHIEKDPQLNVDVKTEKEYYKDQAQGMTNLIFYLGWPLSIVMAFGALAGALNTMYTSVSQRAVEIATLRAIGFSNSSAFFGTLVEAMFLAVLGGVIGTVAAYIFFDGISTSTLGGSFSQIVFAFEMSGETFKQGIFLALTIGLVGGVFPAARAARLPVITAFAASS